jgi:hypothetical protein
MKPIQALSAVLALLTATAATAAVPAQPLPAPGARAVANAAANAAATANASPSGDTRSLALWTYCGMYSRPDGRVGIKCYTV